MGLICGSGSFTRFVVKDKPPDTYGEDFPENIERFAFRKLDETSEEERSIGWVNLLDPLDSRFPGRTYFKEPYLALSLRIDVRKVPAKALKQYCTEAENEIKERENLEFLSKGRRQEIKESVRLALLKRTIPRTNTYDMIWDLNSGVLLFGAVNPKLCDEFSEFFSKTFELPLATVFPYSLASQFLEKEGTESDILDHLAPSRFMEVG
jgi:DNA recombination-dependent growth factor C